MKTVPVSEIFFSYQGEGLFTGQPQIFVRLAGCNLKCDYCDTPLKRSRPMTDTQVIDRVVELSKQHFLPLLGGFTPLDKTPCSCHGPKRSVSLKPKPEHSKLPLSLTEFTPTVSITGGEPLLHADFLEALLFKLKARGFNIYLETNGTLPEKLKQVISCVDTVSMDFKLPSSCGADSFKKHEKFLKIANRKAFVKIVITDKTKEKEISRAASIIKKVSGKIPLVLQFASPLRKIRPPDPGRAYSFVELAGKYLDSCTLGLQMHKLWKIR
jgi:organic radical activating enzyme